MGLRKIEAIQSITSTSIMDSDLKIELEPDYVALDGAALENLEVNSETAASH